MGDADGAQAGHAPGTARAEVPMDTVFTNFKAGMEGVDQEKVKALVHELSKVSTG